MTLALIYGRTSRRSVLGLAAGAVVVPLNMVLSAAELEYQVGHSGASVLVVCSTYRNRDYRAVARQVRDAVGHQLKVVVTAEDSGAEDIVSWARLTQAAPDDVRLPSLEVADPTIMMYTSGTTGRPKGAVHTHRFISTLFGGIDRLEIRETDALLLFLPLFHGRSAVRGRNQSPHSYACRSPAVRGRTDAAGRVCSLLRQSEAVHDFKRRQTADPETGLSRGGAGLERCHLGYEIRSDRRNRLAGYNQVIDGQRGDVVIGR